MALKWDIYFPYILFSKEHDEQPNLQPDNTKDPLDYKYHCLFKIKFLRETLQYSFHCVLVWLIFIGDFSEFRRFNSKQRSQEIIFQMRNSLNPI